jgi:DHA2 family methylenomycin A resistance protein-like MFS transporter
VLGGLALIIVASVVRAGAPPDASYAWVALGLVLLGFGVSFTLPALTGAVVLAAPPAATGAASGVFSVVRQSGATIGVAAATAIIGADIGQAQGAHVLMAIAAAAAGVIWWAAGRQSSRSSNARIATADG